MKNFPPANVAKRSCAVGKGYWSTSITDNLPKDVRFHFSLVLLLLELPSHYDQPCKELLQFPISQVLLPLPHKESKELVGHYKTLAEFPRLQLTSLRKNRLFPDLQQKFQDIDPIVL